MASGSDAAVAAAGPRGDIDAVRTAVAAAGWSPSTTEVEASTLGTAWWGTDRYVEVVTYPSEPARVAAMVSDLPGGEACGWCGHLVPAAVCAFCHHTRPVDVAS